MAVLFWESELVILWGILILLFFSNIMEFYILKEIRTQKE